VKSRSPYIPLCPICRYDVSGLPDGLCPECGNRFSHARIRALWEASRHRKPPGHGAMTAALILALPPICLIPGLGYQLVAVPAMWALAYVWLMQHGETVRKDRGYWVLWLVLPSMRTPIGFEGTALQMPMTLLAAGLAIAILQYALRHSPRESMAILLGSIALATLPFGLLSTLIGLQGTNSQHYWGAWDVPKAFPKLPWMGPSHVRAMTNSGMLRFGLICTFLGAAAAAAGAAIAWAWVKDANRPPERKAMNPLARRQALDHLKR
jgi:hypothetical protein